MRELDESPPFVSVLVPMRNEERHIERCLRSLLAQDYPPDRFEILVIDGRSTDRSRRLVESLSAANPPQVRLIENPRLTTASGLNLGLAAARGSIIVRVDAHATVETGFLSQSVAALERSGADAVGGPIRTVGEGLAGGAIALAMSSLFGVGDAAFRYADDERWTDTVAFAAYRRELFDRLGPFAEDIVAGEDDEFHYRLGEAGGRVLLTPKIRSTYHSRATLPGAFAQYFRYGRAKVEVLRRHPRQARVRQAVPAAFVGALIAFGLLAVPGGPWALPIALLAAAYALATLIASLIAASRGGRRHLPLLPLAFASLHIGYGLGSLVGLARLALRRPVAPPTPAAAIDRSRR